MEPGAHTHSVFSIRHHANVTSASGAEIRDVVTTLHATLDLNSIPASEYRLAVRRQSDDWHFSPASVK